MPEKTSDALSGSKKKPTAFQIAMRRRGYPARFRRVGQGFLINCPMPRHPKQTPHQAFVRDTPAGVKVCCLEGHRDCDVMAALKAAGDVP